MSAVRLPIVFGNDPMLLLYIRNVSRFMRLLIVFGRDPIVLYCAARKLRFVMFPISSGNDVNELELTSSVSAPLNVSIQPGRVAKLLSASMI